MYRIRHYESTENPVPAYDPWMTLTTNEAIKQIRPVLENTTEWTTEIEIVVQNTDDAYSNTASVSTTWPIWTTD